MLTNLFLKNFAIVDEQSITFTPGLNVLSGETGAGKSILIDALGLQLGGRADTDWIRHGENRADILSHYELEEHSPIVAWLNEHELLDEAGHCQLRRTLNENGKSQAYINGIPATVGLTKQLGSMLVNIHGQHAHQSLTSPEKQRDLLDTFAQHDALKNDTQAAYQRWRKLQKRREDLHSADQNLLDRKQLIEYQLKELAVLALQPEEFGQLEQVQKQLASANERLTLANHLQQMLDNDSSGMNHALQQGMQYCDKLQKIDTNASELAELLSQAQIYLDEMQTAVSRYISGIELEPEKLEEVESRMSALHTVARKYQTTPDLLPALQDDLLVESEKLTASIAQLASIDEEIAEAYKDYQSFAKALSESRQQAATRLAEQVTIRLQTLNLANAEFFVELSPTDNESAHGVDKVVFMFSGNAGQVAKPLHKIASGGELSRVSLAIQVASVCEKAESTLIFDEVDSGIGGATAEVVGQLLKTLSRYNQIICVTHLAQVAAYADQHINISKSMDSGITTTKFHYLDEKERIEELARMSGGINRDEKTLEHAQHLRQNAIQFTQNLNS